MLFRSDHEHRIFFDRLVFVFLGDGLEGLAGLGVLLLVVEFLRGVKLFAPFERRQRVALLNFRSTKIGNQNETIFALKEIVRRGGFKTNRCVTSVSGRSVIVRYVTMAQMPAAVVSWIADRCSPL